MGQKQQTESCDAVQLSPPQQMGTQDSAQGMQGAQSIQSAQGYGASTPSASSAGNILQSTVGVSKFSSCT